MRYTRGGTDGELPVWPDVRTKSSPIFPQKLPKMAVTTVFASPVTFSKMTLNVIKYLGYFCKEKMSQRTVLNAQFGHTASSSKNWLFIWKSGSRIGRLVPTYTNTYVRIPTYLHQYIQIYNLNAAMKLSLLWLGISPLSRDFKYSYLGSGCGSVGRAVASNSRSLRLKSRHLFTELKRWKWTNKWPGMAYWKIFLLRYISLSQPP